MEDVTRVQICSNLPFTSRNTPTAAHALYCKTTCITTSGYQVTAITKQFELQFAVQLHRAPARSDHVIDELGHANSSTLRAHGCGCRPKPKVFTFAYRAL